MITESNILPWVSFLLGLAVAVLQIYVAGKLAKIKEDILTIVRSEVKDEMKDLEDKMVTKDVLKLRNENLELMMKNIEIKIDRIK